MSIDVMKQALLYMESVGEMDMYPEDWAIAVALRAAIEQAQEPVAWVGPSWLHPETRTWESQSFAAKPIEGWIPLYTAPRERMARPEQGHTINCPRCGHCCPQPAQKPVAWMYTSQWEGDEWFITRYQSELSTYKADKVWPLYTAPRQWVGLTDEEIAQGNKESWVAEQAWQSAVWWAETKLKEKNNA